MNNDEITEVRKKLLKENILILGKEGIEEIREVIRNIISYQKLMFGITELSDYVLTNYQSFNHYKSLTDIVAEVSFSAEEWEVRTGLTSTSSAYTSRPIKV